jgi:hypothetical protein
MRGPAAVIARVSLVLAFAAPLPALAADAALSPAWFTAATASAPLCAGGGRRVHIGFERAAAAACSIDGDGHVHVTIAPENKPINPSPWYGLVVASDAPAPTLVTLHYGDSRHRYAPWTAEPGRPAVRLDPQAVTVPADQHSVTMRLPPARTRLLIAQPPERQGARWATHPHRCRAQCRPPAAGSLSPPPG